MKSAYALERGTLCTLAARADVADYYHPAQPLQLLFLPLQLSADPVGPGAPHQKRYIDAAGPAFVVGAGFLYAASYFPL